jgi:hypothetical protein
MLAYAPDDNVLQYAAELDKLLPKADVLVTTVSAAHVVCIQLRPVPSS